MKRVIEVLKKAGVVDELDKIFNMLKPPQGMPNEVILKLIKDCIVSTLSKNKQLEFDFFEAMMMDASEAIKNEIHIEHISVEEAKTNIGIMLFEILRTVSDTRKE